MAIAWVGLFGGLAIDAATLGALALATVSVALYEWARRTVGAQHFYIGLTERVPAALVEARSARPMPTIAVASASCCCCPARARRVTRRPDMQRACEGGGAEAMSPSLARPKCEKRPHLAVCERAGDGESAPACDTLLT